MPRSLNPPLSTSLPPPAHRSCAVSQASFQGCLGCACAGTNTCTATLLADPQCARSGVWWLGWVCWEGWGGVGWEHPVSTAGCMPDTIYSCRGPASSHGDSHTAPAPFRRKPPRLHAAALPTPRTSVAPCSWPKTSLCWPSRCGLGHRGTLLCELELCCPWPCMGHADGCHSASSPPSPCHLHLQGLSAVVFLALPAAYSLLVLGRLEASAAAGGASALPLWHCMRLAGRCTWLAWLALTLIQSARLPPPFPTTYIL